MFNLRLVQAGTQQFLGKFMNTHWVPQVGDYFKHRNILWQVIYSIPNLDSREVFVHIEAVEDN